MTPTTKSNLEIEIYSIRDSDALEDRVKYHIEMAEHDNQTTEFHYSICNTDDSRYSVEYSLLTIRRPKEK